MAGTSSYNSGTIGEPGPAGALPYNAGTIGPPGPVGPSPYNTPGTIGSAGPAGSNPYNQGTIGSAGPAGSNPYHSKGIIGSTGPAGSDPYHFGLIGNSAPAGIPAYNTGRIGNSAPAGVPAYNNGRAGSSKPVSKPSYNQGLIGTSDPVGVDAYHYTETIGDKGPIGKEAYNKGKIGNKNALNGDDYNRGRIGSPVLFPGPKPLGLDPAEVVGPGEYSGAYHGDIVFYLQRAGDGGGDEGGGEGYQLQESEMPSYDGGSIIAGDMYDGGQSGWNQSAVDAPDGFDGGGPAGKIPYEEEPPGSFSVAGSETCSLGESIVNAFPRYDSFEDREEIRTKPSSEFFFNKALNKAFNPDSTDDILESLERGSKAELALQLAKSTGYVNNTEDFINGLNSGRFGHVTQATKASNALVGKNSGMTYRSMK